MVFILRRGPDAYCHCYCLSQLRYFWNEQNVDCKGNIMQTFIKMFNPGPIQPFDTIYELICHWLAPLKYGWEDFGWEKLELAMPWKIIVVVRDNVCHPIITFRTFANSTRTELNNPVNLMLNNRSRRRYCFPGYKMPCYFHLCPTCV